MRFSVAPSWLAESKPGAIVPQLNEMALYFNSGHSYNDIFFIIIMQHRHHKMQNTHATIE